jgi:hypothetical protein
LLTRLAARSPDGLLGWTSKAMLFCRGEDCTFLDELLRSGADHLDPSELSSEHVARFKQLSTGNTFVDRVSALTASLARAKADGTPFNPTYLFLGFELANTSGDDLRLGAEPSTDCDVEVFTQVRRRLEAQGTFTFYTAVALWRDLGRMAGLDAALRVLLAAAIEDEAFRELFALASSAYLGDDWAEAWPRLAQLIPALIAATEQLPKLYQRKFAREIQEWVWQSNGRQWDLLRHALPLLKNGCRPPFDRTVSSTAVIHSLLTSAGPAAPAALLRVPDAVWLQLEKATSRSNDATLIHAGFRSLCKLLPDFAFQALTDRPKALIAAARSLGRLTRESHRQSVLRDLKNTELWTAELESYAVANLRDLYERLPWSVEVGAVPRALREHFEGKRSLSAAQLAGHHQRMLGAALRLKCESIKYASTLALCGSAPLSPDHAHAFAIAGDAAENRRALRRLLRARLQGDTALERSHPITQSWLRRTPQLHAERWFEGLQFERDLARFGPVTINVERDILEVLKVGTYAGSCLGLGGGLAYSAAAIALDANKQVLYARDRGARVIARQLVAITRAGTLLPYSVYPVNAPAEVKALFAEYDKEFARYVNAPLADSDADYEVELLLARGFWDDGAWFPEE